jgi:hypothetical protein
MNNHGHQQPPARSPRLVTPGPAPRAVMYWDGGERAITAREKSVIEEHRASCFSIPLVPVGAVPAMVEKPVMLANVDYTKAVGADYMAMGANSTEGLWPAMRSTYVAPLYAAPPAPSTAATLGDYFVPAGWKLVPERMALEPSDVDLLVTQLQADADAEDVDDRWCGATLWVGETVGDHGEAYYGLNFANVEVLEEGSLPLVEFHAPPARSVDLEQFRAVVIGWRAHVHHAISEYTDWEDERLPDWMQERRQQVRNCDSLLALIDAQTAARPEGGTITGWTMIDGLRVFDVTAHASILDAQKFVRYDDHLTALAACQPAEKEPSAWLIHWPPESLGNPEVTTDADRVADIKALGDAPRIEPLYSAQPPQGDEPNTPDIRLTQAVDLAALERIRNDLHAMSGQVPDEWADPIIELQGEVQKMIDSGQPELRPRPMDTAPRDGTMVRLLVEFEDHATDDNDGPSWTIGSNNDSNVPDGERVGWQFAGWCWAHDHFTDGTGTPVGWLPMIDSQKAEDAEACEAGQPECGPVAHHDSEGVPLCQGCWDALLADNLADDGRAAPGVRRG